MRKQVIISIVLLIVAGAIVAALTLWPSSTAPENANANSSTTASSIDVTVEVIDNTSSPQNYPVQLTTDRTAFAALLEAANTSGFTVDYDPPGEFGVFVKGINGLAGSNDAFWSVAVNGTLANQAADRTPVEDGDVVTWEYTPVSR